MAPPSNAILTVTRQNRTTLKKNELCTSFPELSRKCQVSISLLLCANHHIFVANIICLLQTQCDSYNNVEPNMSGFNFTIDSAKLCLPQRCFRCIIHVQLRKSTQAVNWTISFIFDCRWLNYGDSFFVDWHDMTEGN